MVLARVKYITNISFISSEGRGLSMNRSTIKTIYFKKKTHTKKLHMWFSMSTFIESMLELEVESLLSLDFPDERPRAKGTSGRTKIAAYFYHFGI